MTDYYEYCDRCNIRWRVILKLILLYVGWAAFFLSVLILIFGLILERYWSILLFFMLIGAGLVLGSIGHLLTTDYKYVINGSKLIIQKGKGYKKFSIAEQLDIADIVDITDGCSLDAVKYFNGNGEIVTITADDNRVIAICTDKYMLSILERSTEL